MIFIGSPIWWFTITPPVSSFRSQHHLEGKKIVPFITHGGYGLGRSISDIQKLAPKSVLLKEHEVEGAKVNTTQEALNTWLKKMNL